MIFAVLLILTISNKNVSLVFCRYHGLNVGILPKFVFLCSNPNTMAFEGGAFGRFTLGHGIRAFKKRKRETPLSPCACT